MNEGSSGWQRVNFATPVAVTAGTTYVASYHTNAGHYSVTRSYFASQFNSGLLQVPANGGVYGYGAGGFPTQGYQGSNYWVDVSMTTTPPPPSVVPATVSYNASPIPSRLRPHVPGELDDLHRRGHGGRMASRTWPATPWPPMRVHRSAPRPRATTVCGMPPRAHNVDSGDSHAIRSA